jgi:hypothetical protein
MAWYAERGWSTESQTARKEDIKEWWREYSTLTRQLGTPFPSTVCGCLCACD